MNFEVSGRTKSLLNNVVTILPLVDKDQLQKYKELTTLSNVLKLTEILIRFTAESSFEGPLLSNETRYDQINYIFEFLLKRPLI